VYHEINLVVTSFSFFLNDFFSLDSVLLHVASLLLFVFYVACVCITNCYPIKSVLFLGVLAPQPRIIEVLGELKVGFE